MKKNIILLGVFSLFIGLIACQSAPLPEDIPEDHFDAKEVESKFDSQAYLDSVEGILTSITYNKKDLTLEGHEISQDPLITRGVIENMISLYATFEQKHDTYSLINFFDHHMIHMGNLDREILLNKMIEDIEEHNSEYQNLLDDPRFKVLGVDYISRVTDIFLDNFVITEDILLLYPDMTSYIEGLKKTINGGYQIRKIDNKYYLLTDYASALVRYRDYVSDESLKVIDILASESRNPVFVEGYYQRENETAAYKANEIEAFLKTYPNSVYFKMMRSYYIQYLNAIVSNPRNIEMTGFEQKIYKDSVVTDFNRIIDRYSNSNLAKVLIELLVRIEEASFSYDPVIIDEIYQLIDTVY